MKDQKIEGLKIYNTLSGTKERFTPIHKDYVGMYVCGPSLISIWYTDIYFT